MNIKNINYEFNQMNLFAYAIIIIFLDQASKMIAVQTLSIDKEVPINKLFSFHRIYNVDTFMLEKTLPIEIWQYKSLWVLVALILVGGILWVMKQRSMQEHSIEAELCRTGLFILFAAALGNGIDVIFRDGVVDFFRINLGDTIPIVNFADFMIYFGELCIIFAWIVVGYKKLKSYFNKTPEINR